jgi:hypothetical protein
MRKSINLSKRESEYGTRDRKMKAKRRTLVFQRTKDILLKK